MKTQHVLPTLLLASSALLTAAFAFAEDGTTAPQTTGAAAVTTEQPPQSAPTNTQTAEKHAFDWRNTPEPVWVSEAQFEKQLQLVHGKIPDPNIGLFGPRSQMWRITKYAAPGGLGSGRALALQISHPWVTAGIDEHSITRDDPLKRGRLTFHYLGLMTYGNRDQALQAARDVRRIHEAVKGYLRYQAGPFAEGSEYRANEERAMLWVHATLMDTIVKMYEQSIGPISKVDKEKFWQESKLLAYLFGLREESLPATWDDFQAYVQDMLSNGTLVVTPASKDLQAFLYGVKGVGPILWFPMQYMKVVTAANLPNYLNEGYGFGYGPVRNSIYKTSMWVSRVGHKFVPSPLTQNPLYKEGLARLANKKAGWFTRLEIKMALGESRLTNDK